MDDFLGEARGFEGAESDFKYILDSDVFHNVPMTDHLDSLSSSTYYECDYLFDDDPLVSTDKMVSGEPLSPATPHIACEHSYSLTSEPNSPSPKDIKQEVDDLDSNFGSDNLDEMLPISPETDDFHLPLLSSTAVPSTSDRPNQQLQRPNGQATSYLLMDKVTGAKSILTTGAGGNNRTLLTGLGDLTPIGVGGAATTTTLREKQEGSKIKLELVTTMNMDHGLDLKHHMPPTPPGSTASDSDGGESPQRSTPPSPRALAIQPAKKPVCHARTVMPQLFTNIQKLPQSGPLVLTEEEKRTLRQEGYPVPNKLPLSKAEEKSLKKVRRKIKNKISAQESRRKKKEYLEALEKRMDSYTSENSELRRKVETLETTNQSLSSQLTKLQSIVNKISKPIKANSTQTGTCLMVLVLCFAVFLGSWTPHSFLSSSNQSLHRLFSPSASVSPSSSLSSPHPKDLPSDHPFLGPYGPYGLNDQYSDISDIAMDIDDHQGDQVFQKFGPQLVNDDAADPYGTHSMRSSRTLLSYHEDDEVMSRYFDDSIHAPLGDMVPQVPSFGKMAAAVMGSDIANLESDEGNYEAYLMHPDMEAKIIPVDTMALINRSANK